MEKENLSQLELFSQTTDGTQSKNHQSHRFIFNHFRNHEKIILIFIGFAVIGIVCFSLGVKKGKNLAMPKINPRLNTALNYQTSTNVTKINLQTEIEKQNIKKQPSLKNTQQGGYTIQVASYQNKIQAQKEMEALKNKKFMPLVFSKGKYTVVCVGSFSNKETAQTLLAELKKYYRDCFIRRI